MNFCKESDKYISLYIDESLDDKSRIEFLKHIEGCSQCAAKLKEASYVADLCREVQDIQLPEDFSESLHKRLSEINMKDSKSKFGVFVYNKKFIASLSTAAILFVSILAYNLLPQMSSSKDSTSMASDTVQVETSTDVSADSGSSKVNSSIRDEGTSDSAKAKASTQAGTGDNASANVQVENKVTSGGNDVTLTYSEAAVPTEGNNNSIQAKRYQDKAETSTNSNESSRKKENDVVCYSLASANQNDANKYFSNYAELNLKVSSERIEIEIFRNFMKEFGANELKPVTINSVVENSVESTAGLPADTTGETPIQYSTEASTATQLEGSEYIDYYLPLSLYSTLESQAAKNKLELSTKTDIIKDDITDKYNVLNNQKSEIDKKIAEALIKSENTSAFEAEKIKLTEEMNKIIAEKEMITVRVFYIL